MSGATSYHAGLAAEEIVKARYASLGMTHAASRWRGRGGEIDLIFRDGRALIFVEVKASKTLDAAAARLSPRQAQRIMDAAQEYAGGEPQGLLSDMRVDLACVDAQGRVAIIENALGW
ncbi:MAG: YraN family protein [Paracoccaceae bacterium]